MQSASNILILQFDNLLIGRESLEFMDFGRAGVLSTSKLSNRTATTRGPRMRSNAEKHAMREILIIFPFLNVSLAEALDYCIDAGHQIG